MKRLILAAALSCSAAASSAQGIYGGIWKTESGLFTNIAHNGSYVIATLFMNTSANGIPVILPNGQRFYPPSYDIGEIMSGPVVSGVGSLTGVTTYQACSTISRIAFTSQTTYTLTLLSISQTDLGHAQGINCIGVYASRGIYIGATGTATKIF